MSEFIEPSEQESPKGTETRESSVFEPPTYSISFNEDFTLKWEPAVGSMELAIALCYYFPLENTLEDKMRAATKLFLKQKRKEKKSITEASDTVASNSTAQTADYNLPASSSIIVPLVGKANETVQYSGNKNGMRIMKWNPELQGFSQKRSRRKLNEDEAVKVAANRGYACEDHKRRKLKCDPNRCNENGQNLVSRISKPKKSKIGKASLSPHNDTLSEIIAREQVIPEKDFVPQNSYTSIYVNEESANLPFETNKPILLDPTARVFTPSSIPPSPFTLSPLSSVASSATLSLLDPGSYYRDDLSNFNVTSDADTNSFGPCSYDSSFADFDWQLPVKHGKVSLKNFDTSIGTPELKSDDTFSPLDEEDLSWNTWFNHIYGSPKDNISPTSPESHGSTYVSLGRAPEPWTIPPPYTQTRSVRSHQTASQDGLNEGIPCRSELPSRSGPRPPTRQPSRPTSASTAQPISRSSQTFQSSDKQPGPQSISFSSLSAPTERASHTSNAASDYRHAPEYLQKHILLPMHLQDHNSIPLSDKDVPMVPNSRSRCQSKIIRPMSSIPAYPSSCTNRKYAKGLPWKDGEEYLADELERIFDIMTL